MKIALSKQIKKYLPFDLPEHPPLLWYEKLVIAFSAIILVFFRAPYEFANPQLWAEDGTIFLSQARTLGFQSVVTPYAGYLHVLPRFIAFFAQLFPLANIPLVYFTASLLVLIFTCCYLAEVPWLPPKLKIIFPFVILLAPHNGEIFLTLTNIHWLCAILLPFIAFNTHRHGARHLIKTALLLLVIGLSDPFVIVFYLLFVIRPLITPKTDRKDAFVLWLVATLTVSIQLFIFHSNQPHEHLLIDTNIWHWIEATLVRPTAGLFLGKEVGWIGYTVPAASYILGIGLSLFCAILSYAILTSGWQTNRVSVGFVVLACLSLLASFVRLCDRPLLLAPFVAGERYYFLPFVFVCFALVWFYYTAIGWRKQLGLYACCIVLLSTASVFQCPRKTDLHWRDHIANLKNEKSISVPLNPPGWNVILYR